ncbi:MAG: Sulfotransferase protein [Chlamydiia bacterium]|nr:Sulfotransferase protein [Chlamydiia bacterium]
MTGCDAIGSWNGKLPAEEIDRLLLEIDSSKFFSFSHANEPHYLDFAKRHPEYVKLFEVRDLRDVMVSAVFHFNEQLEKRGLRTFDEKLTFILTSNTICSNWIENNAKLYPEWIALPNTYVIRFEDLIGKAGKGSRKKQKETISLIFSVLNMELTQAKLNWIADNLFGHPQDKISWTFRKGHIGDWKIYFQDHHKRFFNKRWGKYQKKLGYSLCKVNG